MMQIPEKAIVTVQAPEWGFSADVELPVNMPLYQLRIGLLRLLREKTPRLFSRAAEIKLIYNGKMLDDDRKTLASLGIWEGSVLTLKLVLSDEIIMTGR